jgi:hypothetical protein
MASQFLFRREIVIDGKQKLVLEANSFHAYVMAVSKNVLTGAPIVIGPSELDREKWLALAEHCRTVADLLSRRKYLTAQPEIY